MTIDTDNLLTTERVRQELCGRFDSLLQARGGSLQVVSVAGGVVRLRFLGQCRACMASDEGLRAQIQEALSKALGNPSIQVRIHESVSEDLLEQARRILHRHEI